MRSGPSSSSRWTRAAMGRGSLRRCWIAPSLPQHHSRLGLATSIPTQSAMIDSPEQRTRALVYGLAQTALAIVRASLRQWSGDPGLLTVSRGTQALAVSRSGLEKAGRQLASAYRPL